MKITSSRFLRSVSDAAHLIHDNKKQIAFVGRSNVGKSSLINMLVNNGKLAKTSSTPGRTRLVNYFVINEDFYFVDLPGYGYAKASKSMVYDWQGLIEPYLTSNLNLKCVCVLVDSRHEPSDQDKQMIDFLSYYNIPFIIIATKCDKHVKSKLKPALTKVANALGVGTANVFGTSSETRYGKDAVLDKIENMLNIENSLQ